MDELFVRSLCEGKEEVEAKRSFVLISVKVWNKVEPPLTVY